MTPGSKEKDGFLYIHYHKIVKEVVAEDGRYNVVVTPADEFSKKYMNSPHRFTPDGRGREEVVVFEGGEFIVNPDRRFPPEGGTGNHDGIPNQIGDYRALAPIITSEVI